MRFLERFDQQFDQRNLRGFSWETVDSWENNGYFTWKESIWEIVPIELAEKKNEQ